MPGSRRLARISTAERQLQSAGDVTGAADLLQAPVDADVTVLASVDLGVLAHRIAVLSALGEVGVVDRPHAERTGVAQRDV